MTTASTAARGMSSVDPSSTRGTLDIDGTRYPDGVMIPRILVCCATALSAVTPAFAAEPAAIGEIARQFDTHPLIMFGELHRGQEIHVFLQQMLRDPRFICEADDVVVEFGNSRLQALADTYVSGGDVSLSQLQTIWRETAVPLTWNSPLYAQVFETLRDINAAHLCPHPVRILLGDPPLDWSKVQTAREYEPFTDRDGHYADVVEREVLARQHRAFLIAGELHAMKRIPKDLKSEPDELSVAGIIERRHPGALFCIVSVPQPDAAKALGLGVPPSFRLVHRSALENRDFQLTDWQSKFVRKTVGGKRVWLAESDRHWPRMGEVVDGIVYLDGNHSLYSSPTIYLDPDYQCELRRRAAIIESYSGQDFLPAIDALVEEAEKTHP
jgi:hypothetical protein